VSPCSLLSVEKKQLLPGEGLLPNLLFQACMAILQLIPAHRRKKKETDLNRLLSTKWTVSSPTDGPRPKRWTSNVSSDLVFGPLPSNAECIARMPTCIGNHGDHAFQVLMYEIMLPSRLVSKLCSHFCTKDYWPDASKREQDRFPEEVKQPTMISSSSLYISYHLPNHPTSY